MPFDARFVAISRLLGKYSLVSQFNGHFDKKNPRLADVSTDPGFRDFAAVFSRDEFKQFANNETSAWLQSLPSDVDFIMVVLEEWESGLGD
jgi:hypothetical protein